MPKTPKAFVSSAEGLMEVGGGQTHDISSDRRFHLQAGSGGGASSLYMNH